MTVLFCLSFPRLQGTNINTFLSTRGLIQGAGLLTTLGLLGAAQSAHTQTFTPGNLVVSRSVYTGTASTLTIGQTLPGRGKAIADGSYPNVFKGEVLLGFVGVFFRKRSAKS